MPTDWNRQGWPGALDAHLRSAHSHEVAAVLFERLGEPEHAAVELERAAAERAAHARALAPRARLFSLRRGPAI